MPKVTLTPDMLFMGSTAAPERAYLGGVLGGLRKTGRYQAYQEPMVGAWVGPTVAVEAGWEPRQIWGSDVGLFSTVLGTLCSGGSLADLDVRLDGALVDLGDATGASEQAAVILWTQLLARLEHRARGTDYWNEVVTDTFLRRREHMASIREGLEKLLARLRGVHFQVGDWRTHMLHLPDEQAVLYCYPPTVKGGYEKFFDTGGRLTWREPTYVSWEPERDMEALAEWARDAAPLVLVEQQAPPRGSALEPVYARHAGKGTNIYIWCNRPQEVRELVGGTKVRPRQHSDILPLDEPLLPEDYQWPAEAVLEVRPIGAAVAAWYKQRWLHRLAGTDTAYNYALLVDGYVAGAGGYSFKAIQTPYPGVDAKVWAGATIMRYAFGAPHDTHRVSRLMTRIALQRNTLLTVVKASPRVTLMAAGSDKVVTTEYTRQPAVMRHRGLMKLASRDRDKLDGYHLVYWSPMRENEGPLDAYREWLADEAKYLAKRAPGLAPGSSDLGDRRSAAELHPRTSESTTGRGQ